MIKKALGIMLLSMASYTATAQVTYVTSSPTKINYLLSYNADGGGDVIFRVSDPVANCENGYWLTKADPGFGANLSMLLAAYQSKTTVKIFCDPAIRWPLSNVKYCKLYGILYQD